MVPKLSVMAILPFLTVGDALPLYLIVLPLTLIIMVLSPEITLPLVSLILASNLNLLVAVSIAALVV